MSNAELRIVDGHTGRVVIDAQHPQRVGAALGAPADRRFVELARPAGRAGVVQVGARRSAYRRVNASAGNANDWILVSTAKAPAGSVLAGMGPVPLAMLAVGADPHLAGRGRRCAPLGAKLETQASTDAPHRPRQPAPAHRRPRGRLEAATAEQPALLALFDLNGFKDYNDTYGHPAGDALLMRLGAALADAVDGVRRARLPDGRRRVLRPRARRRDATTPRSRRASARARRRTAGLHDHRRVRRPSCFPPRRRDASEALRTRRRRACTRTSTPAARRRAARAPDVLLARSTSATPSWASTSRASPSLRALARRLGLERRPSSTQLRHAALLHDVGKLAIPDAISTSPPPLDPTSGSSCAATRSSGSASWPPPRRCRVGRSCARRHERLDGGGYPDGLAGDEIPLGARIIAVCDAFDAMTSRPAVPRADDRPRRRSRSSAAAPARSSTPRSCARSRQ